VAWDWSQYRRRVQHLDSSDGPADPLGGARRILFHGVTGSGKTTAAMRVAKATGIPWTSVDDLTWEPGWVPVPEEEQRRRIAEVCARETWLLDSAYGAWLDIPLESVDLVVALDYPRWFSLQRLVRRTVTRALARTRICNGNTESWASMLGDDSIIRWHFRSFDSKREQIARWAADPEAPRVMTFTRARDLDDWIAALTPVDDRSATAERDGSERRAG
jgi:adenylate kinase family enzyme